jgi:hypothetical protein
MITRRCSWSPLFGFMLIQKIDALLSSLWTSRSTSPISPQAEKNYTQQMSSSDAFSDSEMLSVYVKEYRRLEEFSKRSFDMMAQSLASPFTVSSRQCEDVRQKVVQCYQHSGSEMYQCSDRLDEFTKCSDRLQAQHLALVGDFLVKRDAHRAAEASSS